MDSKLQERLYREFPYLYSGRKLPPSKSLMCFGFMVEDGWFDIIRNLSMKLARLSPTTKAFEVKEKFAILRFYTEEIITTACMMAIRQAEEESAVTCEECGKPGVTRELDDWLYTRCDRCWKKLQKRASRNKTSLARRREE